MRDLFRRAADHAADFRAPSASGRQRVRPTRRLTEGIELANSWGCDGHKWLNVPYDAGFVFCAHPQTHGAAVSYTAAYLLARWDDVAWPAPVAHLGVELHDDRG